MPSDVSIAGRKVRLRPTGTRDADHDKIVHWRTDPDISRWFFSSGPVTLESHLAWFAQASKDQTQLYLAIDALLRPRSDELLPVPLHIGTVGLVDIDASAGCAEFGRLMIGDPDFRSCGYAKEASCLLLRHAFERLELREVRADVLANNETALALYSSLGFRRLRLLSETVERNGEACGIVRLRLDAAGLRASERVISSP